MSAPVQAPSASLYVGDLSKDSKVNEVLLNDIFQTIGPISSIKLCRDVQTRRSLGYAYVNFHMVEDAERAIATKNFTKILGKPCRIMWCQRDPRLRKSGKGNIFIKNLPVGFDDEQLWKMFSQHGKILSSKVAQKDGKLLDYGFVHFEDEKSAAEAISKENNREINGQNIVVQVFKPKAERGGDATTTNVYVKGFPKSPEEFGEKELEALFAEHGEITSAKVVIDAEKKENKGFAFVNFATKEAAAAAVAGLHEKTYKDTKHVLYVQPHQSLANRKQFLKGKYEQANRTKFAGTNLFIKNLGDKVDDAQLNEMFAPFGTIKSGKVMVDESKKSKGFGFVNFENPEDATKAVSEMNNKMINGKPLYVALAQTKAERRERIQQGFQARQMKAHMQMYPGNTPMFYGQVPQQQRVMYNQQQMMQRQQQQRFYAGQPQRMMQPVYNMVPGRGGPAGRGRGGNRKGGRGRGGNQGFKFTNNARNMQGQPQNPNQQKLMQQQMAQAQAQAQAAAQAEFEAALAQAEPEKQKQILGERIYPEVAQKVGEQLAGKITGMLLEMATSDLVDLLKSQTALSEKIAEAREVLGKASVA